MEGHLAPLKRKLCHTPKIRQDDWQIRALLENWVGWKTVITLVYFWGMKREKILSETTLRIRFTFWREVDGTVILSPTSRLVFPGQNINTILLSCTQVHKILWVAHNFVFRNQNKWFVYWRTGSDRKQEVNVNKCKQISFLKRPSLFLEG